MRDRDNGHLQNVHALAYWIAGSEGGNEVLERLTLSNLLLSDCLVFCVRDVGKDNSSDIGF